LHVVPRRTEKSQWGDAVCFKVGGKIFVVPGPDNPRLSFKCTPEAFAELIERENIRPSPCLGRHNWGTLERLDAVGNQQLRRLA
jgi:predicted DNA-binding protein (MmcQ/YjbR family)